MYDYDLQTIFRDPRAVIVPGTRSHPEWRGRRLGEVLQEPDGPAFLEYLANGGSAPFGLKLAAALVLAQERGWMPAAVARPQDTRAQQAQQGRAKPKKTKAPDFWAILKLVETFSNKKSRLPILARVLVRGWENWRVLAATDLEAWIKVLGRDESPGRFSGAVAGFPEGTTGFVPSDRGISAVAHGMLHHRESLPAEDFPALPPKPKPKTLLGHIPAADLARALDQAANAAAGYDPSRPALECVALYIQDNIEVRGSDGYHLYVARVPWWTGEVGQTPDHLLIHRTAAEKVSKALARLKGIFALGIVEKDTNGYLYLGQGCVRIWARLHPGKFPEVSNYIGTKVVGTVDWPQVQEIVRLYKTTRRERVVLVFRVEDGTITVQPYSDGEFRACPVSVGIADPEIRWKFALNMSFLRYDLAGKVCLAALPDHITPYAPVTFTAEEETLVVMPMDIKGIRRWDLDLVTPFGEVLVHQGGNLVRYRIAEFLSDEDLQRILDKALAEAEDRVREDLALVDEDADEILVPLRSKWRIQEARVYLDLENEDESHWVVPSYVSWVQVKFSMLLREALYQALTQRLGPADA